MVKIPIEFKADSNWKITWSGDEKWVETDVGRHVDVYSKGITGRDSPLHDHEIVKWTKKGWKYEKVDRSALRADPKVRAMATRAAAETSNLNALGTKLSGIARGRGSITTTSLMKTVTHLEARNTALAAQQNSIAFRGGKWTTANNALQTAERAATYARSMTEKAARLERIAAEKATEAARLSAEVQAKAARIQAEAAVKTARAQAEAAVKTSRAAAEAATKTGRASAEAAARTGRATAEATLKTLRATAEAAAKTARAAAEAAAKAILAAAEATARAAIATGKAVAYTAAAIAAGITGGG